MRIIARWILAVIMACTVVPATAGTIGFLDAERAVATVQQGQRQLQALEAWATPKRQQIEAMRDHVAELNQQLNAQRTIASEEALRELENNLLRAQREFEDAGRQFNRDLEGKQNEFLAAVATQVGSVATEYAEANGFDAIFVLNAQPLVYVSDAVDITDEVIKLYDEKYPVN